MSAGNPDFDAREGRDEVDLGGALSALAQRKGLIAVATLGCAATALAFCFIVKPRYVAEARVIVEDQESYYTRPDPATARSEAAQLIDAEAINSQMQLVSSRDLARKVASALQLQKLPEFDPASGPLAFLSLLGGAKATEDRLLTTYFDHLQVMSPTKSRIIQIEFSSRDPDLAATAANTIADVYIDLKQQAKRQNAREAAQSLKPLIADLQKRVTEADAKVAAFRLDNGLYDSAENRSLPTQQLGDLATKLADARATQSEALAKAKSLRDLLTHGRLADAGEISMNDLVRTISARRSALQAQLAADSRTLLPGHPKIKEMQAQLSDVDMQLRAAVEKAARGLENDARVAATRVANLSTLLDEQKRNVGIANGVETSLRDLQRQAKTLKDQLEAESAKYQAALAREKSENTPADARVVSRALAPSLPAFPKKIPITLFGAAAGLFFSAFYVIAYDSLGARKTVSDPFPPSPSPASGAGGGEGAIPRQRRAWAGALAPAGGTRASAKPPEPVEPAPIQDDAAKPSETSSGLFAKLKHALQTFAAPAVKLDDPKAADAKAPAAHPVENLGKDPFPDIWMRDPFLQTEAGAQAPSQAKADPWAKAGAAPEPADARRRPGPPQVSRDLVERIAAAGDAHGVTALLADAGVGSSPLYALVTARALSREGRAILVQACPDGRLDDAFADGADLDQPGLAQLLAGEASYAETIYRDGETRLHLLGRGGALDADAEDLGVVIEVLRATYDFVLIAAGSDALGLDLARQADVVVVLGVASARRDYLQDDFAAAGAKSVILATPDVNGHLTEGAA